ncbi:hypothetical protein KSP39_PZI014328 [Platanthera zijinensis]|uniref:Uncharacterized protein n=1 Tax=Platanthera zijinensis TaxID=2320716 RepID=A0AAP0BB03_9ASPA
MPQELYPLDPTEYDITNHGFQDAMFPHVMESVEAPIERFIDCGFAKDGVETFRFLRLFPELEEQVTVIKIDAKGKAVVDEEEEEGESEAGLADDEAPEDAGGNTGLPFQFNLTILFQHSIRARLAGDLVLCFLLSTISADGSTQLALEEEDVRKGVICSRFDCAINEYNWASSKTG